MYNTIQYTNTNTTNYPVRFRNAQKVNKVFNMSLILRGFQEHGMNILYPLHVTGFDTMSDDDKKEAETVLEEMLCTILYLENSDKDRFDDLKKRVKNDYVLNKAEYPITVTAVGALYQYFDIFKIYYIPTFMLHIPLSK